MRSPYGIGWRRTATRLPSFRKSSATRRVVWLLPEPVRTAQIAATGFDDAIIVSCGERSLKLGTGSERLRADVQHVLVGHVRVREDDLVHLVLANQLLELRFRVDRNPVRVELACEERGVDATGDVGDLRGGEGDDLELLAAAVDDVEVVEVAPGRAGDQDLRSHV